MVIERTRGVDPLQELPSPVLFSKTLGIEPIQTTSVCLREIVLPLSPSRQLLLYCSHQPNFVDLFL